MRAEARSALLIAVPQPVSRTVATSMQDLNRGIHSSGTAWLQTPSSHLQEPCLNLSCPEHSPRFSASSVPPPLPCQPDPISSLHLRSTAQALHLSNDKEQGEAATGKRTTISSLQSIKNVGGTKPQTNLPSHKQMGVGGDEN